MSPPNLNYFTCTLGQAVEVNSARPHEFETINDFLDVQASRYPDLPAVGFPRPGADGWVVDIFSKHAAL